MTSVTLLGGWCSSARAATWTMVQHPSRLNCTSPCAVTVTSTGAGHLLVGLAVFSSTGQTITSITGGTSVHPGGCAASGGGGSSDLAYVLSATGGATTITFTGTAQFEFAELIEYSNANGAAFDVCANRVQTSAGTNIAGVSAGTLTGTNDVINQWGRFSGTATGCPNSSTNPNDQPNGDAACGLINSTNNAAGNYANASSTAALSAIAFKESGGTSAPSQQMLTGVGD